MSLFQKLIADLGPKSLANKVWNGSKTHTVFNLFSEGVVNSLADGMW